MDDYKKRVSTTLDYFDFKDFRMICEEKYHVPMAKVIRQLIHMEILKYYDKLEVTK